MRRPLCLLLMLLGVIMAVLPPVRVQADCAWPSWPQAVNRAEVVVYGTVADVDIRLRDTYYTVTPEVVYRGQPTNPVVVHSPSGRTVHVSEDYAMQPGTSHTLYLRAGGNGYYETGACAGSHEGKPGPEEIALMGQGTAPPPPTPTPAQQTWHQWIVFVAMAVAFGAMGIVLLSTRRRRRAG